MKITIDVSLTGIAEFLTELGKQQKTENENRLIEKLTAEWVKGLNSTL